MEKVYIVLAGDGDVELSNDLITELAKINQLGKSYACRILERENKKTVLIPALEAYVEVVADQSPSRPMAPRNYL